MNKNFMNQEHVVASGRIILLLFSSEAQEEDLLHA